MNQVICKIIEATRRGKSERDEEESKIVSVQKVNNESRGKNEIYKFG